MIKLLCPQYRRGFTNASFSPCNGPLWDHRTFQGVYRWKSCIMSANSIRQGHQKVEIRWHRKETRWKRINTQKKRLRSTALEYYLADFWYIFNVPITPYINTDLQSCLWWFVTNVQYINTNPTTPTNTIYTSQPPLKPAHRSGPQ